MSPQPIRTPASERMTSAHRRLERAIHYDALRRDVGKPQERFGLPEEPLGHPEWRGQESALIAACLGILKAHRDDLDRIMERLERLEEKTA